MLDSLPSRDTLPLVPAPATDPASSRHGTATAAAAIVAAAQTLLPALEAGRKLDSGLLRSAMTASFGADDTEGAWSWKDAYEASETALVLFLRRYGRAMRRDAQRKPDGPRTMLDMLADLAALEPSQTRRSEDQLRLQQFSTPLPLAYAALQAAAIRPGDVVLEPSAGTGMLAIMALCALGPDHARDLHLNEIADVRSRLLAALFPTSPRTAHDAETVADRLPDLRPSLILMNPPFSASPGISRTRRGTDLRHIRSAASMLPPGGRLVTISSARCSPASDAWSEAFRTLDPPVRSVFTSAIDGRAYARRGTSFETRITVLDRGRDPATVPPIDTDARADDSHALLAAIRAAVPARLPVEAAAPRDLFGRSPARAPAPACGPAPSATPRPAPARDGWGTVVELDYTTSDSPASAQDAPRHRSVPGMAARRSRRRRR